MNGAVPPLHLFPFMAWTWKTSPTFTVHDYALSWGHKFFFCSELKIALNCPWSHFGIFPFMSYKIYLCRLNACSLFNIWDLFGFLYNSVLKSNSRIVNWLIDWMTDSFILSTVCLTSDPQLLPKPVPCSARSSASSFNSQYALFSLAPYTSCLRLLPRLPVNYILILYLSFSKLFQKAVRTQAVANPVSLPSIYCTYDIPLLLARCQVSISDCTKLNVDT